MAKGSKAFQFNREAAKSQALRVEKRKSESQNRLSVTYFKFPSGITTLRVLPPGSDELLGAGLVGMRVVQHFVDLGGERLGIHVCGRNTFPEQFSVCPICNALVRAQQGVEGFKPDKMLAKGRAFFNAIVKGSKSLTGVQLKQEHEGKVVVLDAPVSMFDWAVSTSTNEELDSVFFDPRAGKDVLVKRSGEGLQTKYEFSLSQRAASPAFEDEGVLEEQLEKLPNLLRKFGISTKRWEQQLEVARKILLYCDQTYGSAFDGDIGISDDAMSSVLEVLAQNDASYKEEETETEPEAPAKPVVASKPVAKPAVAAAKPVAAQAKPAAPAAKAAVPVAKPAVAKPSVKAPTPAVVPLKKQTPAIPECFGQFKIKNGAEAELNSEGLQPECQDCQHSALCFFES